MLHIITDLEACRPAVASAPMKPAVVTKGRYTKSPMSATTPSLACTYTTPLLHDAMH